MKIDTLVEDIYKLFDDGVDVDDALIDELGKNIAETIKDRMGAYKVERESYLRPSNIGRKNRFLFYDINNYPKEELQAHTKIKFLYGDILEHVLLFFTKVAGHEVTGEQDQLQVEGIKGSRDCVIDGVTVDVKSASTYSFKKFKEQKIVGNDPFGYLGQMATYIEGDKDVDQNVGAWLVIDKTLGHICLSKIESMDLPDIGSRVREVKKVLESDTPPERCYEALPEGKSGNMRLDIGCSYCSYKEECWKDVNDGKGLRTFLYSNGIKQLTHVEREPNVKEIQ